MNLHLAVSGLINAVNPFVPVIYKQNTGYTIAPDGKQIPSFANPVTLQGQFQNLSAKELQQLDGLNLEGDIGALYIVGSLDGVVRRQNKGGDLVTLNGKVCLVIQVLEQWPDWCKVAICYQGQA